MEYFFEVSEKETGLRLDQFLAGRLPDFSRSFLQKLIRQQRVSLNEETVKPSAIVEEGDEVRIQIPEAKEWHIEPENIPLNILYQDEQLLVVNKPAGMVVHPGSGVHSGTLVHALLYHVDNLSGIGGIVRPGIVHRLDKNTSGLMVIAKTDPAHMRLQQQFQDRTISRTYLALVWGTFQEKSGEVNASIGRSSSDRKKMSVANHGKPAITRYQVIQEFPFLSLLHLHLLTGRTHQIRVHMKHIHHPVFGDPDYNGRESQLNGLPADYRRAYKVLLDHLPYQFLHAFRLTFIHPVTGERMTFEAPIPDELSFILSLLEKEMKKNFHLK